jgi:hypothetical protein
MQTDATQTILIILFVFFGTAVPLIIRVAAGIVGAEEVTPWRCIKAGLLGISGLAAGMKIGGEFHSLLAAIIAMAFIWMAWIQYALKTSIPQTFGIWLMTHGSVFLIGMACNRFFNLQDRVLQLVAK